MPSFFSLILDRLHLRTPAQAPATAACMPAPRAVGAKAMPVNATARPAVQKRPLRVLRVHDGGRHGGAVSRLVISGSIADVCAELERLAA